MQESELVYLLGKIKSNDLVSLKDKNLDKKILLALNLKSPKIGVILGIFFGVFGVDRFYKGDIFLGIIKLILSFISHAALFTAFLSALSVIVYAAPDAPPAPPNLEQEIDTIILYCFGIWFLFMIYIVCDLFLVYRGIKKDNFQKILMVI
ncbi:TM2 domain-containing protein [Campylobacter sp. Cr9]|uniref:NINE protein n=1 Tax=unclassified Campylobacter TaxID=2593542 RepID=UPI001EFA5129|nr:TM2 domain-containing protein [Campylobacter sp. RM5004]MBZ7985616.1 TM2 domain-containing protein [Campylobacter sp. Cr9]ULO01924.1 TM2 domain-containing protein [Campylobacter sp. RM5004]